jgi:hypothetical protein
VKVGGAAPKGQPRQVGWIAIARLARKGRTRTRDAGS